MGSDVYQDRDFARFYDWTHEGRDQDLPFYLDLARAHGRQLLELACGTGRLTLPLARHGFLITGVDLSAAMLEIARAKLAEEPPRVADRVRLLEGDMSDFRLGEQFDLAFIPFASFFHLLTDERRRACCECLRAHLRAEGVAVVDLVAPDRMARQAVGQPFVVKQTTDPETGAVTVELNEKLALAPQAQRVTVRHTYVQTDAGGAERRYSFVQDYAWLTEEQMGALLEAAAFTDLRVYGGYDHRPYDASSARMIFLAR